MSTPLHLADVLHQFLPEYKAQHALNYADEKICRHIEQCRTAKMGEQRWQCGDCLFEKVVYCSCRDRHCPRCQRKATQQWVEKQENNLIAGKYFHVVFTLPHELNVVTQYAPEMLYKSLFQAVWQTLSKFAQSRRKQSGQLGVTAVLHTWGQTLSQHIHLHCLIPGGLLNEQQQYRGITKGYLFPVKALSTVFRAKMLKALREHDVSIPNPDKLMLMSWCVYSKRCMCQATTVIRYLGRYTRQGVLYESRLQKMDDKTVTFSYKDYRDEHKKKSMKLTGEEFIRRYLSHFLPKGFMRIRHFGFLANRCRRKKLAIVRLQLPKIKRAQVKTEAEQGKVVNTWFCPQCKQGILMLSGIIKAKLMRYESG